MEIKEVGTDPMEIDFYESVIDNVDSIEIDVDVSNSVDRVVDDVAKAKVYNDDFNDDFSEFEAASIVIKNLINKNKKQNSKIKMLEKLENIITDIKVKRILFYLFLIKKKN